VCGGGALLFDSGLVFQPLSSSRLFVSTLETVPRFNTTDEMDVTTPNLERECGGSFSCKLLVWGMG